MSVAVGATSSVCAGCSKPFGLLTRAYVCPTPALDAADTAKGCGERFCWNCINFACVTETEGDKAVAKGDLKAAGIASFCKACYQANSPLGFGTSNGVEIFEPAKDAKDKNANVFFAHGGGGCRLMFLPHAQELSKLGYRAVIFDLPGHGTLMDSPLSLDSAITHISSLVAKYTKGRNLYVGGSLGGYIGMELLARQPDVFSGAVITMCGQAVGTGASLMARAGLVLLGGVSGNLSSASLLATMRNQANANGHLDPRMIMDGALRTGFFFGQNDAQIAILRASDPVAGLGNFKGPVLFVNGSKDHRDSEKKWLEASNKGNGDKSMLVVYEGADHFFSHDERYYSRFMKDMAQFFDGIDWHGVEEL
jgi:pimeloyl-ACP methyl ester carboxylesterase